MGQLRQFRLPDVGEGLTEGEILSWLVAVGDTVTVNQPLCEVETAKAAVELPSPYAGTVTELLHEVGTTVDVGAPIITIDVGGDVAPPAPSAAAPSAASSAGADSSAGSSRTRARDALMTASSSHLPPPTKNGIGLRGRPAWTAIGSQVLRSRPLRSPRMTGVAVVRCSVR